MRYWLMKSEPEVYSIDKLKKDGFTAWEGVRNFQARNFMRDDMKNGDLALFYHSNANPSGVAGVCRICKEAFPDHTALDPKSPYYDPKATSDHERWMMVEVEFVEKFESFVSLSELKLIPELKTARFLQKGSRLSITPLDKAQFEAVRRLGRRSD